MARGVCIRCRQPSDRLGECSACQARLRPYRRAAMRELRNARRFLMEMMLLAENRCVRCGQPKADWRQRRCLRCRRDVTKQSTRIA